ncbi:MAG: adenylate/guanylate cyclase domain-containing protein [Pseudomonadota bacterium]
MGSVFLQETEATVVVFDLKGFVGMAHRLRPVDLGAALSRFYEHAEQCVLQHRGRIIKFVGDLTLAAWLALEVEDHRLQGLLALREAHHQRCSWVQQGIDRGLPPLDYSLAIASGPVLAGQIGTDRLRSFDILGQATVTALKLATVATARSCGHLIAGDTVSGAIAAAAATPAAVSTGASAPPLATSAIPAIPAIPATPVTPAVAAVATGAPPALSVPTAMAAGGGRGQFPPVIEVEGIELAGRPLRLYRLC